MEPLPSLLAVDLAEAGGRWRWGREGQRGAHFPSPPGSILPVLPVLAAQLPAGTGCTHLLLVKKFRAFFSLHLNIPKTMRCLGFLWGRPHSFLNSWFPRELLQEEKADLISSPIIQLLLLNQTINTARGSGVKDHQKWRRQDDCSKSSGRDFLHRRTPRENGHMERRKSKRTDHV